MADTIDGISPGARWGAYAVYACGGCVIMGVARGIIALSAIIHNYAQAKFAQHHQSAKTPERGGYEKPKEYFNRISKWANQEGLRALKEISLIGGWCLTWSEVSNYSKGGLMGRSKGVSTWGLQELSALMEAEPGPSVVGTLSEGVDDLAEDAHGFFDWLWG